MTRFWLAAAGLVIFPATAQEPARLEISRAFRDAGNIYHECGHAWAKAYAKSHEPAGDIADAAIAACAKTRSELVVQVAQQTKMPSHQVLRVFQDAEREMRGDLMRAVIETRNRSK